MELTDLTPEQRAQLVREALADQEKEKKRIMEEKKTYKNLICKVVDDVFPYLEKTSEQLKEAKTKVYNEFKTALEMKRRLFDVEAGQATHSFINATGTRRIILGNYTIDNYDDTANEGITIVKEYISGLGMDDDSRFLVKMVLKLLSKDKNGSLKPSNVIQLRQLANERGNARFIDGVKTIENAYKPLPSKTFVRAEYKDDTGIWRALPLGMTEA